MKKKKKTLFLEEGAQVSYQGRWVDKKTFRVFVYNKNGEEKLADSYSEYQDLLSSGIWFSEK